MAINTRDMKPLQEILKEYEQQKWQQARQEMQEEDLKRSAIRIIDQGVSGDPFQNVNAGTVVSSMPHAALGLATLGSVAPARTYLTIPRETFASVMRTFAKSPIAQDPGTLIGMRLVFDAFCAAIKSQAPMFDSAAFAKECGLPSSE